MPVFQKRNGYNPLESLLFDRVIRPLSAPFHDYARRDIEPRLRPGMRVLDVGCGGGVFTLPLAERFPEIELVGIDLSRKLIGWAGDRAQATGSRVRFIEASALDLPFDAGSFDLVYSLGSLKHWTDPGQGVREAARVLAPGGWLYIVEGERDAPAAEVDGLIDAWRVPGPLRPVATAFFTKIVSGSAPSLPEAQALLAHVPELDARVERGEGMPLWALSGARPSPAADAARS